MENLSGYRSSKKRKISSNTSERFLNKLEKCTKAEDNDVLEVFRKHTVSSVEKKTLKILDKLCSKGL